MKKYRITNRTLYGTGYLEKTFLLTNLRRGAVDFRDFRTRGREERNVELR